MPESENTNRERPAFPRPDLLAAHEEDDRERWRHATLEEKGRIFAELQDFVDAVGNYPPKRTMFPGWKNIRRGTPDAETRDA